MKNIPNTPSFSYFPHNSSPERWVIERTKQLLKSISISRVAYFPFCFEPLKNTSFHPTATFNYILSFNTAVPNFSGSVAEAVRRGRENGFTHGPPHVQMKLCVLMCLPAVCAAQFPMGHRLGPGCGTGVWRPLI